METLQTTNPQGSILEKLPQWYAGSLYDSVPEFRKVDFLKKAFKAETDDLFETDDQAAIETLHQFWA